MARAVDQFKANARRLQEQEEELSRTNTEIRKREHEVEVQRQRLEDSLEAIPNAFQLWGNDENYSTSTDDTLNCAPTWQ